MVAEDTVGIQVMTKVRKIIQTVVVVSEYLSIIKVNNENK